MDKRRQKRRKDSYFEKAVLPVECFRFTAGTRRFAEPDARAADIDGPRFRQLLSGQLHERDYCALEIERTECGGDCEHLCSAAGM
jgi:predicted metal-binding protein